METNSKGIVPVVQFTKYTKHNGILTKRYSLNNGALVKHQPTPSPDAAERVTVSNVREFEACLSGLHKNQAVAFGLINANQITVKALEDDTQRARSKENCYWRKSGAGVLLLDLDFSEDAPIASQDEAWQILTDAVPALANAPALQRPSCSSFIYNKHTGEELQGLRGMRVYVFVNKAEEIPTLGKIIMQRLWLKGHGRIQIASNGSKRKVTIVDGAVFQPERLDYAAGASVSAELEQRYPAPIFRNEDAPPIQTKLIKPLSSDENCAYQQLVDKSLLLAEPESADRRELHIQKRAPLLAAHSGITLDKAKQTLRKALSGAPLPVDFVLYPQKGDPVTVGELIANPAKWNGKYFADPSEPEYRNDNRIARALLGANDKSKWCIHSFAHGEVRYSFDFDSEQLPTYYSGEIQKTKTISKYNFVSEVMPIVNKAAPMNNNLLYTPTELTTVIAPAGIGKTKLITESDIVKNSYVGFDYADRRVPLIAVPTVEKAREIAADLHSLYPHKRICTLVGRTQEDITPLPEAPTARDEHGNRFVPMCWKHDHIMTMDEHHIPTQAQGVLCKSKKEDAEHKCEHFNSCGYQRMRSEAQSASVIVTTHAQLALGVGVPINYIFIDELALTALLRGGECNKSYFQDGESVVEITHLVEEVAKALRDGIQLSSIPDAEAKATELRAWCKERKKENRPLDGVTAATTLPELKEILKNNVQTATIETKAITVIEKMAIALDGNEERFWLEGNVFKWADIADIKVKGLIVDEDGKPKIPPIIHFDATGRKAIVEALFKRESVWHNYRIKDENGANITQTLSKAWHQGLWKTKGVTDTNKLHRVAAEIALHYEMYPSSGVIAQKEVIEELRTLCADVGTFSNYGALRGLNKMIDNNIQLLHIFGRVMPDASGVREIAVALWGKSAIDMSAAPERCSAFINKKDRTKHKTVVMGYQHKLLAEVLGMIRDDELVQAVGRMRLIWGKTGRDIVIHGTTPIPSLLVDSVVTEKTTFSKDMIAGRAATKAKASIFSISANVADFIEQLTVNLRGVLPVYIYNIRGVPPLIHQYQIEVNEDKRHRQKRFSFLAAWELIEQIENATGKKVTDIKTLQSFTVKKPVVKQPSRKIPLATVRMATEYWHSAPQEQKIIYSRMIDLFGNEDAEIIINNAHKPEAKQSLDRLILLRDEQPLLDAIEQLEPFNIDWQQWRNAPAAIAA